MKSIIIAEINRQTVDIKMARPFITATKL